MNSLHYPAAGLAGSSSRGGGSVNVAPSTSVSSNNVRQTANTMAGSNTSEVAGAGTTVVGVLSAMDSGPSLMPSQNAAPTVHTDSAVFMDDTADYQQESMPGRDSHPVPVDTELMHFLATPVKVHYEQWDIGGSVAAFNPWTEWFDNPAVKRRLANYALFSAKLVVRVVTNGNAFQYGKLIYGYLPGPSDDFARSQLTGLTGFTTDRLPFQFSVDPSKDSVIELELPWTSRSGETALINGMNANLGAFQPLVLAPLATTSTGLLNPYVDITVFASVIDVKLQGRTTFFPTSGEWKGVLSKPLATMASISSSFKSIPVIGPHADAFSKLASGLSGVTSAFGFSKAADLSNNTMVIPRLVGTLAVTDDVDTSQLLSTDPRNTTNMDPALIGLKSHDEMALAYWFGRYSLVGSYNWTDVQAVDATVFNFAASPFYTTQSYPLAHSYLAHSMLPFKFWRGSLRFKFVIVGNAFHTGRLQISYEPNTTILADPTNTNLNVIVDLAHVTEVVLDVPYIPPDGIPWRHQQTVVTDLTNLIALNKLGNVTATVLSQLRAGGVSTSIKILVYICAGDDFEVAVPSFQHMRNATSMISFFPAAALTADPVVTPIGYGPLALSPALLEEPPFEEFQPTSAMVTTPAEVTEVGGTQPYYTEYSKDHFSDRILSFRNLIKRYVFTHYTAPPGTLSTTASMSFLLPPFPRPAGYVRGAAAVVEDHSATSWSMLSFLGPSYLAYKGGMRYKILPINNGDGDMHIVSKTQHTYSKWKWNNSTSPLSTWAIPTPDGAIVTMARINPAMEVALPWETRFMYQYPQDQLLYYSAGRPQSLQVTKVSGSTTNYAVFMAATDDFTFWLCLGPPVMHVIALA